MGGAHSLRGGNGDRRPAEGCHTGTVGRAAGGVNTPGEPRESGSPQRHKEHKERQKTEAEACRFFVSLCPASDLLSVFFVTFVPCGEPLS
jgi:hypothetical protein